MSASRRTPSAGAALRADRASARARARAPGTAPKRRDAEATRERILKAASAEFARHGFAGARGERIAQRARSSERMVYYYYGSKDALFRAVLERAYARLRDAERDLRLDADDPANALAQFCRFVWRYYLEHPEFISLLNTENLYAARHLRRSAQLGELVSPVAQLLSRMLADGAAKGVFRDDIDVIELYVAIASLGYFCLSNRHTLSAVLGRDVAEAQALERYWDAALRMIAGYVRREPTTDTARRAAPAPEALRCTGRPY